MNTAEKTIFISHSSKDAKLINSTELAFENLDIKPYFAKNRVEGKNPVDKIVEAITTAKAFFLLITPNVVNDAHTRDWVNFEIGVARSRQMKIFVWIDKDILQNKTYPRLLENVTDYNGFDFQSDDECHNVVLTIRKIAQSLEKNNISNNETIQKPSQQPMISMLEAQSLAKAFITSQKPNYEKISISSSTPEGDMWIIKGDCSHSEPKSYGSYNWQVTIKGNEVLSYEFKPGMSFAIG